MSAVRTGRPMSAETRAKIAATKRGKKLSPETRAKMSAAHAGREPMSAETRAKIGAAKRGKTASAETRAKISASKKGSVGTRPGYQPVRKDLRSGKEEDFGPLRIALEDACREAGCSRDALTVLSSLRDPYRLDRPACHRDGQWVAAQVERCFQPNQRIHLRGLHYAIVVAGDVRKPSGAIYRNTESDWIWLAHALKSARWLGYVPFERITDQRNAEPKPYREREEAVELSRFANAGVQVSAIEPPDVYFNKPHPFLSGFSVRQPYAITI